MWVFCTVYIVHWQHSQNIRFVSNPEKIASTSISSFHMMPLYATLWFLCVFCWVQQFWSQCEWISLAHTTMCYVYAHAHSTTSVREIMLNFLFWWHHRFNTKWLQKKFWRSENDLSTTQWMQDQHIASYTFLLMRECVSTWIEMYWWKTSQIVQLEIKFSTSSRFNSVEQTQFHSLI